MNKENKILQLCSYLSLLIGIQGFILAVICARDSNFTAVITSLIYGSLMLATFIILTIRKNPKFFYITAPIIVILLEWFFLYTGGTKGFGIIWITVVPLFTLYLLPKRNFVILNTAVLVFLILAIYTPLNVYMYDYATVFEKRFTLVYLFEFLFAYFLRSNINQTESELKKQKDIYSSEISQASAIQDAFLKPANLDFKEWETAYTFIPMSGISGDFYDYYTNSEDNTKLEGLGIYDISGHGISSGIVTLLAKNIVKQEFFNNKDKPLSTTLERFSQRFIEERGEIERYITGIVVRTLNNKVEIVNAGHQFPLLYKKSSGKIESVKKSDEAFGAIGLSSISANYVTQTLDMESGDELILITDGITECHNPEGKTLGREKFKEILGKHIYTPNINAQMRGIIFDISSFMNGSSSDDDMTIILLRKR